MCELFGASGRGKVDCRNLLQEFFSHGSEHPHGWGVASFEGRKIRIKKEPVSSLKSVYLKNRLMSPVCEKLLLAHIRLATKGSIEYNNTHPFIQKDISGRNWVLEHNGTVFESGELSAYVHRQKGSTDSERILYFIIDQINDKIREKGANLTEKKRIRVIEDILFQITPENKMNLLLCDGELLYVHTNYKKSLYVRTDESTVFFSTKPLDDCDWEELPLNTLLVYRENELVYRGVSHENEFFDSEEKLRYLFLDFAQM